MKRNDINDIEEKVFFQNYENLFNVYLTENDDYFYNILKNVNIPKDLHPASYSQYVVQPGDTWTLLSHRFYDDVKLWWLICLANNIQNPLNFPVAGHTLRILTADVSQRILSKIRHG